MKQLNLNRYSNPLMLTPAEKEIIAEYKLSQNKIYAEVFPLVSNPDDYERSSLMGATDVTYNSVQDVIHALAEIEQKQSLSPEEQKVQIAQVYANMSEEILHSREDMLTLAAYRPDAILWAPYEMVNPEFVKDAMKYNPLVFHVADDCIIKLDTTIDTYRDVLFGEGPKQHPVLEEMGIHKDFIPLVSPKCNLDKLCSPDAYREAFKKVLLDQPGHTPYIDMDRQIVKTSRVMDFLVLCEQFIAHDLVGGSMSDLVLEDFMDDRISAYNDVRRQLEPLAVRNSLVRENLAEFGYHAIAYQKQYEPFRESYRVVPETAWRPEYQLYEHKVQMHDSQRLYALNLYMEQEKVSAPGKDGNTYPQQYIYEIREIHNRMSLDEMNAQLNVAAFWQDVGRAVVDARVRLKNNYYPNDLLWSRQGDKVFINEIKEIIKNNSQKKFILSQINMGIELASKEAQKTHTQETPTQSSQGDGRER